MKKTELNKAYIIRKITDYTGVVFLGILLLFIWQMYREPIAVPFLKPYIIKALNHEDTDYQVTLDSVNLELVRSIRPIKIIAKNVSYKKNDGSVNIVAPKTSVSFSIKAILRGIIAPSSIEVVHPQISIFTNYGVKEESKAEDITKKKISYYFDSFEKFIERFNSTDNIYVESFINDIEIKNAEVEFHEVDLGRKWSFSDLNYSFTRNFTNIETEFNALLQQKDKVASVGLEAQYRPASEKVALRAYFTDVIPSEFMTSFLEDDVSKKIYQVNLPINGSIEALINFAEVIKNKDDVARSLDTAIENVKFQFEGGSGNIMFSDDEEYKYDISAFVLQGNLDSALNNLKIENADFNLGGQPTKLSFYVTGMKKYLLENSLEDLKISLKANVDYLNLDDLPRYWPKYIADLAWCWCNDSISGGRAENAVFTFDFAYDKKKKNLVFEDLNGSIDIKEGNLNYLEGMPTITNLYGKAHFYKDSIKIEVDKGISQGVEVNGGYVRLYDLDKEDNFADINLLASSSVTDALKMIDNQPLGYASAMGLTPDALQGRADIDLKLDFELKQDLKPNDVKVLVKAALTDVTIPNVIQNNSLTSKHLDLEVNNKGLLVKGAVELDGIGLDLLWDEDFSAKNYKSKYRLSFKLDDAIKKRLDINSSILNPPYIKGYADVVADIIMYENKKTEVDINASLANADIDYSFVGFRKVLKEDAEIKTKLIFENDVLKSIPSFGLSKSDFNLKGKIVLDEKSRIKTIDIFDIEGPKSDAQAKIDFAYEPKAKININVSGDSYDLTEFFAKKEREIKSSKTETSVVSDDDDGFEDVTDTDVFISVNKLWTNPKVSVRNFTGSANLRNGIGIYEVHMFGNYGGKRDVTLKLDYSPRPNNEFVLSVDSNNAGSTLKVLRVYENMSGGNLHIEAKRNAQKEFIGHAKIRDFSIHNTPVLAKVFTVGSFTGMVNMLTGEGMAFSHFDAPFEYKKKVLFIRDSKAFGNVAGISADGYYNRRDDSLSIKGMIAPAYSLNTMLGKIPLVGSLLAGKDGTVFAANYNIKGDIYDPEVDINTLSALSPNSLKDLLNSAFGGREEYE